MADVWVIVLLRYEGRVVGNVARLRDVAYTTTLAALEAAVHVDVRQILEPDARLLEHSLPEERWAARKACGVEAVIFQRQVPVSLENVPQPEDVDLQIELDKILERLQLEGLDDRTQTFHTLQRLTAPLEM